MNEPKEKKFGFAGKLASAFVDSKLTPIAIIASILLGIGAVLMLPREEEPQIKVPMIDVLVSMPGTSVREVEERMTIPMEKLLWEIPGVEYVYSTSMPGSAISIVRFKVGSNLENALIRLNQKLENNYDRIPHGVSFPLIKPRSIDDVPILSLTLHSKNYNHFDLRRLAAQIDEEIKAIPDVAETTLIGGQKRELTIRLFPAQMASRCLSPDQIIQRLKAVNSQSHDGGMVNSNFTTQIRTGKFLKTRRDVENIVVGVFGGSPVYLKDVASVDDAAAEAVNYVFFGDGETEEAAVTISVAKRPGTNAVNVVDSIRKKVTELQGILIPEDISISFTRDYGATARDKSDELLLHMGIAVFGVALLILIFLGWRESLVVLLAIPSTLALTLLVFYLYGYTLNRITLFALIFSIGILVDDAIVVVENIVRHARLGRNTRRSLKQVAIEAVDEVGNPTVLATWAVIAAILPMAFVGGLMGPYMRPIPIGSTAAMVFSLLIAFSVTPWAAYKVLRRHLEKKAEKASPHESSDEVEEVPTDWFTKVYFAIMKPLLSHGSWRITFLAIIIAMLLGAMAMVPAGMVKLKMLPFDNKSEFQLVINMPEGTPLEKTLTAAQEIAREATKQPEVENYQIYAGTASPFNFNGLVRHYFNRQLPHQADVQINLLPKHERDAQSHDIAKRVRPGVQKIAEKYGATVAVAEVPPGPPVLQTLVAEIYGPSDEARIKLAESVKEIFEKNEGVVDVDWYVEDEIPQTRLIVDQDKAAMNGISVETVSRAIRMAVSGYSADLLHVPEEKEDVNIVFKLPLRLRSKTESLLSLRVRSDLNPSAPLVPLRELVTIKQNHTERWRYRKNLKPVLYVTGDVAGVAESPAYALLDMNTEIAKLSPKDYGGEGEEIKLWNLNQPFSQEEPAIKWDGEWHITLEVFRDLGIAFAVVLVLIFMLMVGWFHSYIKPLVVMVAIPFSLIGILPAHWALGAFFTATSMIGFMAGAGIVVRNSIILVDFIELRISQGRKLADAVAEAGAVRFRPMLLTALAVVVSASVILADPIFQGLAISLMFGEIASLLISRMAVPVIYYMVEKNIEHVE